MGLIVIAVSQCRINRLLSGGQIGTNVIEWPWKTAKLQQ
jgi:hypothetical protein